MGRGAELHIHVFGMLSSFYKEFSGQQRSFEW
jgi:hypothetical protein